MSNKELIERLNKPCGRTTGHGESCSVGWLCGACADKAKAADALELADKRIAGLEEAASFNFEQYQDAAFLLCEANQRIAELERNEGGGCTLAGPGRGDCEHYVGLQDGAVDAYGKPNGWCWSCWKSRRIAELEALLLAQPFRSEREKKAERKLAVAREACKDIRRAIERECYAAAYIIVSEALAQIGGEDAR